MGSIRGMKKMDKGDKKDGIENFEFIYSHLKTFSLLITINGIAAVISLLPLN
jgi:hypothetical protein